MGWLASGGTDFAYRMSIPVANPLSQGDRAIVSPFPAWFLYAQGKILQSDFSDVHVTMADGTTELPCHLNGPKNQIKIDFASMPAGRTVLYVYYGHATVAAPTPNRFGGGNWLDWQFEKGIAGETMDPGTWTDLVAGGSKVYNHSFPRPGSLMEVKLTAPASNWGMVSESESAGMSSDGAEYRFWAYAGEANNYHLFSNPGANENKIMYVSFHNDGKIYVYTQRTKTGYTTGGYTQIGTYGTGWMESRMVINFTNETYTFSRRANEGDAWTQLKPTGAADYDIPFTGINTITTSPAVAFGVYNAATWYLNNIRYADGGIVEGADDLIVQVIAANDERTGESATAARFYVWGEDLDATYINSAGSYFGAATYFKAGIMASGEKSHLLLKHFEGALPKGAVSAASLHLYAQGSDDVYADLTLKCHRFLNVGTATNDKTRVGTGWALQPVHNMPTWGYRFHCPMAGLVETVAWSAAGAVGAGDIDLDDPDAPSVVIPTSYTPGYKTLALPVGWLSDWEGDQYSQGVLIKDSTDVAGGSNRVVYLTPPRMTNGPVLEVAFSSLAAEQLAARKVATDTYNYYATFPTQNRYVQYPINNGFAVIMWVNTNRKSDLAFISLEGRIHRFLKSPQTSPYRNAIPTSGLFYDPDEKRYWIIGLSDPNSYILYGYSDPYVPVNWTWKVTAVASDRVEGFPKNGVLHLISSPAGGDLQYRTYTRATDTLSAATVLSTRAPTGTFRGLQVGITNVEEMTGAGEITLDGTIADYPAFDLVKIDSEYFWYTGKDSGNNKLTGVTRAVRGSAKATHNVGASVAIDRTFFCYHAISHDAVKNCIHVISTMAAIDANYTKSFYFRHYYADAAGTWKDEADNTLTLPLTQATERVFSVPQTWSFCSGILSLGNGDFLATLQGTDGDLDAESIPNWTVRIARLANLGSAFDYRLLPALQNESSMADMASGKVVMTGLAGDNLSTQLSSSDDYGDTWDPAVTVAAHLFAQFVLWASGCTDRAGADGKGLLYAIHAAFHGAIYLDAVQYIEPPVFAGGGWRRPVNMRSVVGSPIIGRAA